MKGHRTFISLGVMPARPSPRSSSWCSSRTRAHRRCCRRSEVFVMKIVVIGGTGLIGSKLVGLLRARGHEALAAAPSTGVNTHTGEGLARALVGAQVLVDLSNSPSFEDKVAMDFFTTSGRNLLAAEKASGVQYHVALSSVGTERMQSSGYFRAKLAQQNLIRESGVPYTIVHSTQFFGFMGAIAGSATEGQAVRLPYPAWQPI